jgi:hypothetical protein
MDKSALGILDLLYASVFTHTALSPRGIGLPFWLSDSDVPGGENTYVESIAVDVTLLMRFLGKWSRIVLGCL